MQNVRNYRPTKVYFLKSRQPLPFWLRGLLTLIIFFVSFQYFQTKLYHFPDPVPFQGDTLYNPYENLNGNWLKSNFHTHAKAWGGLTNGHQPGDEVQRTYRNSRYDIACISDYLTINIRQNKRHPLYVPVYEHGINLQKAHRLAIGTEDVCFYDVILYHNQSIKQYLVDKLKEKAPLVCIAHPSVREGHAASVLQNLSGYDCLEVLSRCRIVTSHWDAALPAGKPVWILGNDDCHDVTKSSFAACWTMVQADSATEEVLQALKTGKTYGVYNKKPQNNRQLPLKITGKQSENILKEVITEGSHLALNLWQKTDTIRLIGQNGVVKAEDFNTRSLSYAFTPSDTYIRAEIITPEADFYLNPVLRHDGRYPPENYKTATTDVWLTFLWRYAIVVIGFLCVYLLFRREIETVLHRQYRAFPQTALEGI